MGALQGLTEALTNARQGLADEYQRHETRVAEIRRDIATLENGLLMEAQSIDLQRVARGAKLVRVNGSFNEKRRSIIAEAMAELAKPGCGSLKHEYMGTKCYDRWSDQREDHQYGYGPRHGSTVFSVGLTDEARKRDLSEQEVEDALYYLANAEKIKAAEAEGRKKAGLTA